MQLEPNRTEKQINKNFNPRGRGNYAHLDLLYTPGMSPGECREWGEGCLGPGTTPVHGEGKEQRDLLFTSFLVLFNTLHLKITGLAIIKENKKYNKAPP